MIALALFILQLFATFAYADTAVLHPLDPLSQSEINTSVAVLKAAGHVDDKTRFVFLTLREPNKPAVLKWRPGTPVTREAFVIIKQGAQTDEAVVDLSGPPCDRGARSRVFSPRY